MALCMQKSAIFAMQNESTNRILSITNKKGTSYGK